MCGGAVGGIGVFDPLAIRIGIMIGSDSDLKQCQAGLKWLAAAHARVEVVLTNSIHRNTMAVLDHLEDYLVDVWIIAAGKANHLTGTAAAYLTYGLKRKTPVIGVACEGKTPEETLAAILSIVQVPGTQVIFDREKQVGAEGFLYACHLAVEGNFPEIKIPEDKPWVARTLPDAIAEADRLAGGGK